MKSVAGFLFSRWVLGFVGTTLLAGLVWFFGPLLPPFDDLLPRAAVIAVMLLIWLVANLLLDRRRRRRDSALTAGVTSGAAAEEEATALQERLTKALQQLKSARGSRGYLYEQPWYAIIGPPGAGKTTALLNAGLKFPLAAEMGEGAVGGVGGTRMCDWWFTEDAVLIDTAGRYTTQDSDAAVDRAGWEAFLDLLKRTRVRQPLNGVIVGIALSDIALASQSERLSHARAIRRRVKELETRLGVRIPVYALLTKADLISGFTEFFDDLDSEKRGQVWGTTFPETRDDAGPVAGFTEAFGALVARLNARLYDRLAAERSADRRALIAGFPSQVASLEPPLTAFLQETFGGSKLDRAPFLRGVYMASGTQEGTPIDRLTGVLSRAFGLDQKRAASLRPVKGRSYFLTRLLRDVVFNEAMLVAARPGARRRRLILRSAAFSLVVLVAAGAGALIWHTGETNREAVAAVAAALQKYEASAATQKLDPVSDADLPALAPLLDQARALPHGYDDMSQPSVAWWTLGLSQDTKLATASRAVYRHALERALLPRLIWRLEAQMRGSLNQPDFLYEATRVYLMLGGGGPLDRELVHVWMNLDWQATYPGPVYEPVREALLRHLDALMADPMPSVSLDGGLVAAARATFGRVPLVQRVYSRIRPSAAAQRVPAWKPRDALGAAGATLFVRASGKSLDDGIPGFYTLAGFHQVLLPALATAARSVASESWVLGQKVDFDSGGEQMQALENGVIQLYEADYSRLWDAMLADLDVIPVRSLQQAAQGFYILGSPESPMRDVLNAAARQLTLSVPPLPTSLGAATSQVRGAVGQAALSSDAARLQAVLGAPPPGQAANQAPGHEIDERYKALRDLVGNGPGAPIDQVLKILNDLQQQLAKLAALPPGAAAPVVGPDDPAVALKTAADKQPQPLGRWLAAMASSGAALRSGGAKQQTVAAFNNATGPAATCARAVSNHYPFVPTATADAALDDFAKVFSPGGMLDGFFNTQLRPYVAISGRVWKPQAVDGVPSPVSAADLDQFQRAATIRDLFFAGGGSTLNLRFDITPTTLDNGAKLVTLDFDGTAVTYSHGPTKATQITWPGANKMQNVKLTFDPPVVVAETGPWALFRMFGHGRIQTGAAPDRFTVSFQNGDREASFEVHTASAGNPFATPALREFKCPGVQ